MENKNQLPHVVIIGAGFGGLRAAKELAGAPLRVTVVDRNNYHLFQPLLYQVATAGIAPDEIAYPVRAILRRQKNAEFRLAEVERVDLAARRVHTSHGALEYDYLILAVGGRTNFFGIPSVEQHAFGLKGIQDAVGIRSHLLRQFELASQESDPALRRALLTFVVVGGGPTGVEMAGAISELVRIVLTRDHPRLDAGEIQVVLLEAMQRLLAPMPEELGRAATETLKRKHVQVRFGAGVAAYDGQNVRLQNGEHLPARSVIWTAGVSGARLLDSLGVEQGSLGRIKVEPTLQLPGWPEVYCIGDAALMYDAAGLPLPMVAPVAVQQAVSAAGNIRRQMGGSAPEAFRYRDPGSLATIGKNQAVARLGRFKFKGFLAWLLWLVVHLMQLVGFRNRLIVLINWAYDYLFYEYSVRWIEPERRQSD